MDKNTWLGEEEGQGNKSRIILVILLIIAMIVSIGGASYILSQNGKDDARTEGNFAVTKEDSRTTEQKIEALQDGTHKEPTKEQIELAEKFAGVDYLNKAKESGTDPREPIAGIYGVNVPIASDVQKAFGAKASTIASSAIRTYEQLWGAFDLAGAHRDINADGVLKEIQVNTSNITDEKVWNSLAKFSGIMKGEAYSWAGGKDCFLNALGGATAEGKLLCSDKSLPIGEGQWYMQLNAPKVDWAGKTEVQGGVKVTLVRQMFVPSAQKGKTIIASTPVVLYMQPATASGALYDWSLVHIDYGETVSDVVDGTYSQVGQGM